MEAVSTKIKSDYEIERGKPMPSKNHAILQGNIYFLLRQKYDALFRLLPEISVKVDKKERVPDIAIYPQLTYNSKEDEIRMSKAPLGAIEILSPTQTIDELLDKARGYFEDGIKSYWLVLPRLEAICVFDTPDSYDFFGKTDTLKDTALDIELDLNAVFK